LWLLRNHKGGKSVKIAELRDGLRRVDVEAQVIEISDPREVRSRYTGETYRVAEATISDDSGTIKLVLWNEQIGQVSVNSTIRIENGYTKSFRAEVQLNVGRYGKLTVI
jgi:replication factor A1